MTYDDYILVHKKERDEADGCDMCKYEDRQPWEEPCVRCKRNCMDLYEHMEYVELKNETLADSVSRVLKSWKEKR